jgi:hypothetical protein
MAGKPPKLKPEELIVAGKAIPWRSPEKMYFPLISLPQIGAANNVNRDRRHSSYRKQDLRFQQDASEESRRGLIERYKDR